MNYMERFMKMSQEVIGDGKGIIAVTRCVQASTIGLKRIEGNEIKSDNEALSAHDDYKEIFRGLYEQFSEGIHLYKYENNKCVDERHIPYFNPEILFKGPAVLAIYQEYGLEPQEEYSKKELAEAIKAEKIKKTLVYACYTNDMEKIQQHLNNEKLTKAQLNKVLKLYGTPLTLCARNNNLEAFKAIAEKGADIGKTFSGGGTPLSTAFQNSYDIVLYILENYPEQFEKEVKDFTFASVSKDIRVFQLLKDLGYDLHCEGQKHPMLHLCVDYRNLVGLKFLLDNGVDINLQNASGQTALERAERNDLTNIVEFLKSYQ